MLNPRHYIIHNVLGIFQPILEPILQTKSFRADVHVDWITCGLDVLKLLRAMDVSSLLPSAPAPAPACSVAIARSLTHAPKLPFKGVNTSLGSRAPRISPLALASKKKSSDKVSFGDQLLDYIEGTFALAHAHIVPLGRCKPSSVSQLLHNPWRSVSDACARCTSSAATVNRMLASFWNL
jgi:hypothetical protein